MISGQIISKSGIRQDIENVRGVFGTNLVYFEMLINHSTQFLFVCLEETGVKGLGKSYPGSAASIYVCRLFLQHSS